MLRWKWLLMGVSILHSPADCGPERPAGSRSCHSLATQPRCSRKRCAASASSAGRCTCSASLKGPMAWKCHFMRFSYINMSSPSLPMVPKSLEMTLGVKRAVGILLRLKESANALIWDLSPYIVIREKVTSPFSALPAQRIWPPNETMSYDCASATCVCEYTLLNASAVLHSFIIWITILLLVSLRITWCSTATP